MLVGAWEALEQEAKLADFGEEDRRRRAFINAYFKSYFRNGRFFKLSIDAKKLKARVVDRLKDEIPGLDQSDYDALAQRLFSPVLQTDGAEFGKISAGGLVTRSGKSYAFPGLDVAVTLGETHVSGSNVDYVAVGSDLIRVFLHAIFDAHNQLPCVSGATAAESELIPADLRLSVNDPAITHVDEGEFAAVEARATQVEAVTSAGVGRLVRGASWFSLNNEALATAIEAAVGVTFHKEAEKAVWCWYSCRFNESDKSTLLADYLAVGVGRPVKLKVTVTGPPEVSSEISGRAIRD